MSKVSQNIIIKIEQAQLKTDVPAFSPGDTVVVKVREIDDRNRVNLTMKEVTDEEKELALK